MHLSHFSHLPRMEMLGFDGGQLQSGLLWCRARSKCYGWWSLTIWPMVYRARVEMLGFGGGHF